MRSPVGFALACAAFLAAVPLSPRSAEATSILCCSASSDATPASSLDALFDFDVSGTTLTLTVSNTTSSPNEFNISAVYFNASGNVTSISFVSATHSAEGDVTAGWVPLLSSQMVDGFEVFDYGMADGVGEDNPNIIGPGENIEFVFTVNGGLAAADFIVENADGWEIAAKFVNGPGDDSAFGAGDEGFPPIPEPSAALLLGTALAGLGLLGRGRRS
jgi:hypothetical protein